MTSLALYNTSPSAENCELVPLTYQLSFDGRILQRGFWLYIWGIITPNGPTLHYVGRTGDSSSLKAQSPFNRMGQHLGFGTNSNMLRRHLKLHQVHPEQCWFRLISHGPILAESDILEEHRERRDRVGALEKALAESMQAAGYTVVNTVNCLASIDPDLFAKVLSAFVEHFPLLTL
jgi:hypothetical protein